jgi:general secretion pathway protein H
VRGVTLVEVLITVTLIALITGVAVLGMGVTTSARMKRSATMIAGACRIAYGHANATSKTVRLVFDFDNRQIFLEESADRHLVKHGDVAGGAEAATDLERVAVSSAKEITEGPRAPRAKFVPAKVFGFNPDKDLQGKELATGIKFFQVESEHLDEPIGEGRAYLYFFPGGQTQNTAIQLSVTNPDMTDDDDFMTVLIAPLTGKATIRKGRSEMPRPRDESEASERDDSGF